MNQEGIKKVRYKSLDELAAITINHIKTLGGRLEDIGNQIIHHSIKAKDLPIPCNDVEIIISWNKKVVNLLRQIVLFQERVEIARKQVKKTETKILVKKEEKVKPSRRYYKFLDELKLNGLTSAPDIIPLLVEKFPQLNKGSALAVVVKWAERDLVKK